jgi:hypothetical protein
LGGAWYSFEDSTIRIAMEAGIGKFTTQIAPEYIMDNDFEFRRATSIKLGGSTSPPIRRFLDIKETNEANPLEIAYGYVPPNNRWILRLNDLHNIVIDSLPINNDTLATVVYTYHPDIRKLYFFSFNYVNRGRIPEPGRAYGQSRIKPELQIYDPSTLKLLETRPSPDCPADNCPGRRSGGVAETVGDYIVYYFYYGQDSLVRYYPAMLFIFDTRTNEAIWLRVGWR